MTRVGWGERGAITFTLLKVTSLIAIGGELRYTAVKALINDVT